MVIWVRKFFAFQQRLAKMSWSEQLPLFLQDLNIAGAYKEWQIRQADWAVRLYFNNFMMAHSSAKDQQIPPGTNAASEQDALQSFREALRLRHYSRRTEHTYLDWASRYLRYCKDRHAAVSPESPCTPDLVRDFLASLAINRNVSASTQNMAFNSLLMFFRLVFNRDLGDRKNAVRARTGKRLPVVFSPEEVKQILRLVDGTTGLMLKIIYGGGLRINECCRLRIKDIDFTQQLVHVRDGKDGKDRTTVLPTSLIITLRAHISEVLALHDRDLADGYGSVWLPDALDRKYPNAPVQKAWQYLFPSNSRSLDPQSGNVGRHHISDSAVHGQFVPLFRIRSGCRCSGCIPALPDPGLLWGD